MRLSAILFELNIPRLQTILNEVGSLTQVARTRQSFLPPVPIPDGALYSFIIKWIPGVSRKA